MKQKRITKAPAVNDKKLCDGKGWVFVTIITSIVVACGIGFGAYFAIRDITAADNYQVFSDNLARNYSATIFGYYYHHDDPNNVKGTVLARIHNSHLIVTDIDNDSAVIAEADNVISVYFVRIGNNGTPYFYLIRKNGSVVRIDISENGDRSIENLDGYERIVSVFDGGDSYAHLVDIDGNVYKNL